MKSLFVALAIVFGLCLQSAAAQTDTPQPAKEKVKAEVAEWVKAELSKISKELNLTTEQNAQIKTLLHGGECKAGTDPEGVRAQNTGNPGGIPWQDACGPFPGTAKTI